jgi:hypothetical protein
LWPKKEAREVTWAGANRLQACDPRKSKRHVFVNQILNEEPVLGSFLESQAALLMQKGSQADAWLPKEDNLK